MPPRGVDLDRDWMLDRWEYDNGLNYRVNDAGLDKDKDGLSNLFEFVNGTNPTSKDTDSDGLPDGWEVQYGLSPLRATGNDGASADVDGDGLTAHQEYVRGTDPTVSNYDTDGLPVEWEAMYGLDPYVADGNDGDEGDPDGDLLANVREFELDTDPTVADTDGDGFSDGWEATHGYVPTAPDDPDVDSDGDGLTDGWEFEYATDPRVACGDTDGDGLPDGWELVFFGVLGTAPGDDPDADGMTNFQEYWAGTLPNVSTAPSDADGDGLPDEWELAYAGLGMAAAGDPDGDLLLNAAEFAASTSPLQVDTDGDGLSDYAELEIYQLSPLLLDTDDDGISDGDEIAYLGGDPLQTDQDYDGLTYVDELQEGTDPVRYDTDGDGMPDGWEVQYGLDPLANDAGADADIDGITNLQEYRQNTDPASPDDPDADGMPTAWELTHGLDPYDNNAYDDVDGDGLTNQGEYEANTDPRDSDSDDDQVLDGAETAAGTSPLNPDTDSDGLPDWWELKYRIPATDISSSFSPGTYSGWWFEENSSVVSGTGHAGAADPCVQLQSAESYVPLATVITPPVADVMQVTMHAYAPEGGYFSVVPVNDDTTLTGTVYDAYGVPWVAGAGTAWEYTGTRAVRRTVMAGSSTWNADEWTIYGTALPAAASPGHHPDPPLEAEVVPAAGTTEAGVPLDVTVTPWGGVGPYTYEWESELGSMHYSTSEGAFTVLASAPVGSYAGQVTVTDSKDPPDQIVREFSVDVTVPPPAYTVTVNPTEHGTAYALPAGDAREGTTIELVAEPAEGYYLDSISVVDAEMNVVPVTGTTFDMPASPVVCTVTFDNVLKLVVGGDVQGTMGSPVDVTVELRGGEAADWFNYVVTPGGTYMFFRSQPSFSFVPAEVGAYTVTLVAWDNLMNPILSTTYAIPVVAAPVGIPRRTLASPATLVISEVASPAGHPEAGFVEIFNAGGTWDMTESTWHLRRCSDDGAVYDMLLRAPRTLDEGSCYVVAADADGFAAAYGSAPDAASTVVAAGGTAGYFLYRDVEDQSEPNAGHPYPYVQASGTYTSTVVGVQGRAARLRITVSATDEQMWFDDITVWRDSQAQTRPNANEDPDNDGMSNIEEYSYVDRLPGASENNVTPDYPFIGTHPYDPDTDDDTMPDGWEVDHGYNPKNSDDATEDYDEDGINNRDEFAAGTDPADADTDDDGLNDKDEGTYHTDPLDEDTDDDTLPDGWEVQYGLNPLGIDNDILEEGERWTHVREYTPTEEDADNGYLAYRTDVTGYEDDDHNGCDPDDPEITHAHTTIAYTEPSSSFYISIFSYAQYGSEADPFALGDTVVFTNEVEAYGSDITNYNIRVWGNGVLLAPEPVEYVGGDYVSGDIEVIGAMRPAVEKWVYKQAYTIVQDDIDRGYVTNRLEVTCDVDLEKDGPGDADLDGTGDVEDTAHNVQVIAGQWVPSSHLTVTNSPTYFKFWEGQAITYTTIVTAAVDTCTLTLDVTLSGGSTESASYTMAGVLDSDRDGLTVYQEYAAGSSPLDADSDDDGLLDGAAITINSGAGDSRYAGWAQYVWYTDAAGGVPGTTDRTFYGEQGYGTSPTTQDTDGDGLLDAGDITVSEATIAGRRGWTNTVVYAEYPFSQTGCGNTLYVFRGEWQANTDPVDADTDGDSIPDGYEFRYNLGGTALLSEDFVDITGWDNVGGDSDSGVYGLAAPSYALTVGEYMTSPACEYPTQFVVYAAASGPDAGLQLAWSTNDGSVWTTLGTYSIPPGGTVVTQNVLTCALFPQPSLQSAGAVKFRFTSTTAALTLYIDDVVVRGRSVDPIVSDTGADYDNDGVPNTAEYASGLVSTAADTDGDGGLDGPDIVILSTAADPRYASWPLLPIAHTDVEDPPGVISRTFMGEATAGTTPGLADTDSDGFIDFETMAVPSGDPRYSRWGDMRLVYSYVSSVRTFVGELTHGTLPLDFDSDNDGAIDGSNRDASGAAFLAMRAAGVYTVPGSVGTSGMSGSVYGEYEGPTGSGFYGSDTDPLNPDTDGDAMPDGYEARYALAPLSPIVGDKDADGLGDKEEFLRGTRPDRADTDEDTMSDAWEVLHGLAPATANIDTDLDGDGATDTAEYARGLLPNNQDTDGDTLRDGWELAYGLDPLLTAGIHGRTGDADADGVLNWREQEEGTDPRAKDTDGDALPDGVELYALGTSPTSAAGSDGYYGDADADGLSNGLEYDEVVFTDCMPIANEWDTDSDGLGDGFEYYGGLDLCVDGGDDGAEGDPDADNLDNLAEQSAGTLPKVADTDGDGMPDGWEVTWDLNPLNDDAYGDVDGDGIPNFEEYLTGTPPRTRRGRVQLGAGDTYEDMVNDYMAAVQERIDATEYEYEQYSEPGDPESCYRERFNLSRTWVYKRNQMEERISNAPSVTNILQWVVNQYGVEYRAESMFSPSPTSITPTSLVVSVYTSTVTKAIDAAAYVTNRQIYTEKIWTLTNMWITNFIDSGVGVNIPAFEAADERLIQYLPRYLYPKWQEYIRRNYKKMLWFYPSDEHTSGWNEYGYYQLSLDSLKLKLYDRFRDCQLPTERFIWNDRYQNVFANVNLTAQQQAAGMSSRDIPGWKLGSALQYPAMPIGVSEHRLRSLWYSGKSDTNITVLFRLYGVETVTTSQVAAVDSTADFCVVGPAYAGGGLCWASPSRFCSSESGGGLTGAQHEVNAVGVQVGFVGGDAGTPVTFTAGGMTLDNPGGSAAGGPVVTKGSILPASNARAATITAKRGSSATGSCTVEAYPPTPDPQRAPDVWPYFIARVDPAAFSLRVPAVYTNVGGTNMVTYPSTSAAAGIVVAAPHGSDWWQRGGGIAVDARVVQGSIPGFSATLAAAGNYAPAGAWGATLNVGFSPHVTNWAGVVRVTARATGAWARTHMLDLTNANGTFGTVRVPPETLMWSKPRPRLEARLAHTIPSNIVMDITGVITGVAHCVVASGAPAVMIQDPNRDPGVMMPATVLRGTTSVTYRVRISNGKARLTAQPPALHGVPGYWESIDNVVPVSYTRLAYGAEMPAGTTYVSPTSFPHNVQLEFGYFSEYDTYDVADDMSYFPIMDGKFPVGYQYGIERELDFTADPNGEMYTSPTRNVYQASKPVYTRITPTTLADRYRVLRDVIERPVEFAYTVYDKWFDKWNDQQGAYSRDRDWQYTGADWEIRDDGTSCSMHNSIVGGGRTASTEYTYDATYRGATVEYNTGSRMNSRGSCSHDRTDTGNLYYRNVSGTETEREWCWEGAASMPQAGNWSFRLTDEENEKNSYASWGGGSVIFELGPPTPDKFTEEITEVTKSDYTVEDLGGNTPRIAIDEIAKYRYMPASHAMYAVDAFCGGTSEDLPLSEDGEPIPDIAGTRTYVKLKKSPKFVSPGQVATADGEHETMYEEGWRWCSPLGPYIITCSTWLLGHTERLAWTSDYVTTDNQTTSQYTKAINSWFGNLDRYTAFNGQSRDTKGLLKANPFHYEHNWNTSESSSWNSDYWEDKHIEGWNLGDPDRSWIIHSASYGNSHNTVRNHYEWDECQIDISRRVVVVGRWLWGQGVKPPPGHGIMGGEAY